jgi:hypothetical protein
VYVGGWKPNNTYNDDGACACVAVATDEKAMIAIVANRPSSSNEWESTEANQFVIESLPI